MSKIPSALLFCALAFCGDVLGAETGNTLQPFSINLGALSSGQASDALDKALRSEGILQITDIPNLKSLREAALGAAHACISESPTARSHHFSDGTLRRTLAAASGRSLGQRTLAHGSPASESCAELERAGGALSAAVQYAVDIFVAQFSTLVGKAKSHDFFLRRPSGGGYSSLEEAVNSGDRLEHFHTYKVPDERPSAPSLTLDFHVDQGILIAFLPALMLSDHSGLDQSASSGAFVIRTKGGSELEVELRSDALAVLLGDGVNQYINHVHPDLRFHAPSHAFRMPHSAAGLHRVWYGMMQLPPADATNEEVGLTFGQIRDKVVQASNRTGAEAEASLAVGCSRKLQARELSDCAANQIYCWHSCMDHTSDASPSACSSGGQTVACANSDGTVWDGNHATSDFKPRCISNGTSLQEAGFGISLRARGLAPRALCFAIASVVLAVLLPSSRTL